MRLLLVLSGLCLALAGAGCCSDWQAKRANARAEKSLPETDTFIRRPNWLNDHSEHTTYQKVHGSIDP